MESSFAALKGTPSDAFPMKFTEFVRATHCIEHL